MMAIDEVKPAAIAHRQRRIGERSIFGNVLKRATEPPFFDVTCGISVDRIGNGQYPLLRGPRQLRHAARRLRPGVEMQREAATVFLRRRLCLCCVKFARAGPLSTRQRSAELARSPSGASREADSPIARYLSCLKRPAVEPEGELF
jgi:hypothetical protein